MKQNKLNKKLTLVKKTIVNITEKDMGHIYGGIDTILLSVCDCASPDEIFTRRSCD